MKYPIFQLSQDLDSEVFAVDDINGVKLLANSFKIEF